MAIKPEEISALIKRQIEDFDQRSKLETVGTVIQVGDSVARVYGLSHCLAGELLEFPNDARGIALNLEENNVGCVLLGGDSGIKEGDMVRGTGRVAEIPVGQAMLGRVVDPLGQPLDGRGPIASEGRRAIESPAPGVLERKSVTVPLQTGLLSIDSMIPIGRGQRELIIGDRQTGKTAIAIDAILNQKDSGVLCVYAAIGQKASSTSAILSVLEKHGAMDYTVVVSSPASDAATMQYLAPYSACALAEYFMYTQHKDVLVVYDDLSKHAVAYRALSLLLRRPPGREAFPGDVFYLHSRLLERAARLSDAMGGGSITALPIIETQAGDISAYIPTNVISITDGQIFLESELFFSGFRPAVNVGLSVSRVGGAAQVKAIRKVAGRLRLDLAQYRELSAFAQFGSDLDRNTQEKLAQGDRLMELLKQSQYSPLPVIDQVIMLYVAINGLISELPVSAIKSDLKDFVDYVRISYPDIGMAVEKTGNLDQAVETRLKEAWQMYRTAHPVKA
jgi:F-type H+/Na+-transporting ATPase subunit alpha